LNIRKTAHLKVKVTIAVPPGDVQEESYK